MLVSFFYNIVIGFAAILASIKMLYGYWFKNKYRLSLGKRFGFNFPIIKKENRLVIWIHAVSVGETKAVTALVKLIKTELPHALIVISSITETGYAEARRCLSMADYHVYLPFDLYFVIKPILKLTQPDLIIISETDFWYNFLKISKKFNASIALVNGKISQRSAKRFQSYPLFSSSLFSLFDLCCIQNHSYFKRFEEMGIPKEKMVITGNLKFDDEYPRLSPEQEEVWRNQLDIPKENPVIVIGSTHDPEEQLLLNELKKVWEKFPSLRVLIVPRHPERFNEVALILDKQQIPYACFSELNHSKDEKKAILIDAMGLLRKCYQLADIAIVAGSYTPKVGGHNILEPLWYGVPVIYGPYMHSQAELVDLVQEYDAGKQIEIEQLSNVLISLLQDPQERKRIGGNGLQMLKDINGATKKTWEALRPLLASKKV